MKCCKKSSPKADAPCCACHNPKATWSALSQRQKNLVYVAIPVDLALKAAAWHFLYHLPKERIRGPKAAWAGVTTLVGTFGPLAFLCGGIKKKGA